MELANRSDRMANVDTLPLDDSWGNMAKRQASVQRVAKGGLLPTCRRLRRLHMALEHIYVMCVDTGDAQPRGARG